MLVTTCSSTKKVSPMKTNGSAKRPDGNVPEQDVYVIGKEMAKAVEAEQQWKQQGTRESPLPKQDYDFWHGDQFLIAPATNSLDGVLREVVRRYAASDPSRRAAIRDSINQDGFYTLMTLAQRCAVFAMRERKAEIAHDGLIAIAMINEERVDFRDILVCLGLLYHAANRAGADADSMFRQTALLAEPKVGELFVGFLKRPAASRNIRSLSGCDEVETKNGLGFIGWGFAKYNPSIDLKAVAVDIVQLVAADKYQPNSISLAEELPPIWLSHVKNAELEKVLGRIRGGAILHGRLRPHEHPNYDSQQFTVFIVETSETSDAQILLRLSQTGDTREHSMIGVAAGRLFSLVVARAFMDGVEAYETPKTLVRFEEGLTKVLAQYVDKAR